MRARRPYRDRDDVEVEILDALVDRHQVGMTIFELRSRVDVNIETLEPALANLRDDDLIIVEYGEDRSLIRPADRVVPDPDSEDENGRIGLVIDKILNRFRR